MRHEPLTPAPKPEAQKALKRRAKARGKKAEVVVAKKLGGRRVMFSGAGVLEKGDVRVETTRPPLFVEVKYSGDILAKTGNHSVAFQLEWVEKTILDARAAGCVPVIALRFAEVSSTLYVVTDEYLEELLHQSQRLREVEAALDAQASSPQPG